MTDRKNYLNQLPQLTLPWLVVTFVSIFINLVIFYGLVWFPTFSDVKITQQSFETLCNLSLQQNNNANKNVFETEVTKIGLLIQATGNYANWTIPLVESARRHFLRRHGYSVTFFIFSDRLESIAQGKNGDIVAIYQEQLGWPFDSMLRFQIYQKNGHLLIGMDYLFQLDADMKFVATVGPEILGDLVGTLHPGYFASPRWTFPYETRSDSCAHVNKDQGWFYLCGAFYGGKTDLVMKMMLTIGRCVELDTHNHIIPIWHDESYLNHYFVRNPPTILLSSAYCTQEGKGNKSVFVLLPKYHQHH